MPLFFFSMDQVINPDGNDFQPGWQELIALCLHCCVHTLGADQGFDSAAIERIALHIPDNLNGVVLQTTTPQCLELPAGMLHQLLATSQGPTIIAAELNSLAHSVLLTEVNCLYPPLHMSASCS